MNEAPSLPQLRQGLKAALSVERNSERRKELGRALAAITRAESKQIDNSTQKC